jgi:hypothetical protein
LPEQQEIQYDEYQKSALYTFLYCDVFDIRGLVKRLANEYPINSWYDYLKNLTDDILFCFLFFPKDDLAYQNYPHIKIFDHPRISGDETWNRAMFYVSLDLYRRVRTRDKNEFTGRGGSWFGSSRTERLELASYLIEFLLSEEPLAQLDEWLDKHYPGAKNKLQPGYILGTIVDSDFLSQFYSQIKKLVNDPDEFFKNKNATPLKMPS